MDELQKIHKNLERNNQSAIKKGNENEEVNSFKLSDVSQRIFKNDSFENISVNDCV